MTIIRRDHVSHRLLARLGTPIRVALVLGTAQALLSGLGAALYGMNQDALLVAGGGYLVVAFAALAIFELPLLTPTPVTEPEH